MRLCDQISSTSKGLFPGRHGILAYESATWSATFSSEDGLNQFFTIATFSLRKCYLLAAFNLRCDFAYSIESGDFIVAGLRRALQVVIYWCLRG
jgi:hypothetical protein